MAITQNDYDVLKQPLRSMLVKIELLNFQMQVVDTLEGNVVGGSITVDADADIRRTCNIKLVVSDTTFNLQQGGKIWLDKYVRIYYGTETLSGDEIVWTNMGTFIFLTVEHSFAADENILTISAIDLMGDLTGARNGYVQGIPATIVAGTKIRDAIISALKLSVISRYIVADNPQVVPEDLEFKQGSTVFDILSKLRDISAGYEMFFDEAGVFRYQIIPNGVGFPTVLDNDILDKNITKLNNNVSFENVRNVIEVWGKGISPKENGGVATISGNTYNVSIGEYTAYSKGDTIGFQISAILYPPTININSLGVKNIVDSNGNPATFETANEYYVVEYQENQTFLLLGLQQVYAIIKDENPNSPYYVGGNLGEILLPLSGGIYENITNKYLAYERCKYELYLHGNRNDSISFSSAIIPWLDVNQLISYENLNADIRGNFLTKTINFDFDVANEMNVTASQFYPLYPSF